MQDFTPDHLSPYIHSFWEDSILPTLKEYIQIPNKSPQFDSAWVENGHMDRAVELIKQWCLNHAVPDMSVDVIRLPGRTPLLLIDVPGERPETVLLYGHLDKQPEMVGWHDDLGPWTPVQKGDRLYGRGAADDGYAVFTSLCAINALKKARIPHARCLILIEASEESGSTDLPFYMEHLKNKIGTPDLVICLDSGCGNYNQLWVTTSLRGLVGGELTIKVLKEGIHSGSGSGVAPNPVRLLRQLLDRIEDKTTGNVTLSELHTAIPDNRLKQAAVAAQTLGTQFYSEMPFLPNVKPEQDSIQELILRRTWKPALSLIGCDGIPAVEKAGNVTLPEISVKLSMRLSPLTDATTAAQALKEALEKNPPNEAIVTFNVHETGSGWNAPKESSWLIKASNDASQKYFEADAMYMGEGGSIPFMGMLGKQFPHAQFLITGVLGPGANAHGPNEFLHIPMAKKLTGCIVEVIQAHYQQLIS